MIYCIIMIRQGRSPNRSVVRTSNCPILWVLLVLFCNCTGFFFNLVLNLIGNYLGLVWHLNGVTIIDKCDFKWGISWSRSPISQNEDFIMCPCYRSIQWVSTIKSRLVCWYLKQIIMSLKHIFFEMFWYAVADFSSFDIKL